jgi:hypothetical protein
MEDLPATLEDFLEVSEPPQPQSVSRRLRTPHHHLAQLIAEGKTTSEVALITGYSVSYISTTKHNDPAFKKLIQHYQNQREAIFIDAQKRVADLGILAAEVLQERLTEGSENFSNRELTEIVKSTIGAAETTKPSQGPISVNFKFITPQSDGGVIDATAVEIEETK